MAKCLSVMQAEIGAIVGDTSAAFATKLKVWINDRYEDIVGRYARWNNMISLTTIGAAAGNANCCIPAGLGRPLTVYIENYSPLDQMTIREWIEKYSSNPDESGRPEKYIPIGGNKWKLHYVPNQNYIINCWSELSATPLVNASDCVILPCEKVIKLGAEADAWRTKRQFAKARDLEVKYEHRLGLLIWEKESAPDMVHQFTPIPQSRDFYE